MESIDKLIYTLEILSKALSAKDKDRALEAITLLVQQFMTTFGHATRIFLAILFLETLKLHVLCGEFEEATGGALALLARLKAVNKALKQSAARSVPTDSDASEEDVLDDVLDAERTPGAPLGPARGGKREAGRAFTRAPKPGTPFAAYPLIKFIRPGPEPRLLAFVGGFPSSPLETALVQGGDVESAAPKAGSEPPEPSMEKSTRGWRILPRRRLSGFVSHI